MSPFCSIANPDIPEPQFPLPIVSIFVEYCFASLSHSGINTSIISLSLKIMSEYPLDLPQFF